MKLLENLLRVKENLLEKFASTEYCIKCHQLLKI